MLIKNPQKYFSGPYIIKDSGEYIREYTDRPLVIGGKRALEAAYDQLKEAFDSAGITPVAVETFTGFPSERQMRNYEEQVRSSKADCIIALGGGRSLDAAKAAALYADVPVITIPTVAATCAAWAALVIQYDDEGSYVGRILLKESPRLVLADTSIMLRTPRRYLFSGIVDTFAKFYEVRPVFEGDPSMIHMDVAFHATKIAYDRMEKYTFVALEEAEKGIFGQAAKDIVDSVVYLAGFAGAFQTQTGGYCFAHPFYHTSARYPTTRHRMHGEKVAFGILTQLFLEKKDESYIKEVVAQFDRYDNAFTLEDIGLDRDDDELLMRLANEIKTLFTHVSWSAEDIVSSMKAADLLVNNYRDDR